MDKVEDFTDLTSVSTEKLLKLRDVASSNAAKINQKAKLKTVDLAIETYSSDLGCDYRVVERLKNIAFNLQSDILQGRETKIL